LQKVTRQSKSHSCRSTFCTASQSVVSGIPTRRPIGVDEGFDVNEAAVLWRQYHEALNSADDSFEPIIGETSMKVEPIISGAQLALMRNFEEVTIMTGGLPTPVKEGCQPSNSTTTTSSQLPPPRATPVAANRHYAVQVMTLAVRVHS